LGKTFETSEKEHNFGRYFLPQFQLGENLLAARAQLAEQQSLSFWEGTFII